MRDRARFPDVPREAGHYESFYVKAAASGRAVWLRYTAFKRPGAAVVGSLWAVLFDAAWERPAAWKASFDEVAAGDGDYVRIGPGSIGDGVAAGPTWCLALEGDAPAFPYLPRDWMYRARLPRTKALSLYPAVRVSGSVEVGGRRLELDGWPGMVGHNWGTEHAEQWVWLHGGGLDATFGRVRVGPVTLPWVANGLLELDGRRVRLGGLGRRGTRVDARPGRLEFSLPGPDGLVVAGTVDAPAARTVGWRYSDPGGGEHQVLNSSIADLRARAGERELVALGSAAYELGARDAGGFVAIEPFSDP